MYNISAFLAAVLRVFSYETFSEHAQQRVNSCSARFAFRLDMEQGAREYANQTTLDATNYMWYLQV